MVVGFCFNDNVYVDGDFVFCMVHTYGHQLKISVCANDSGVNMHHGILLRHLDTVAVPMIDCAVVTLLVIGQNYSPPISATRGPSPASRAYQSRFQHLQAAQLASPTSCSLALINFGR